MSGAFDQAVREVQGDAGRCRPALELQQVKMGPPGRRLSTLRAHEGRGIHARPASCVLILARALEIRGGSWPEAVSLGPGPLGCGGKP